MIRNSLIVTAILAVLYALVWATDSVTLQGERTVYTARCEPGAWVGDRCTGKLVAAERYRYRVLKPHSEVVFWVVGSSEPSGKFTECVIHDGRNWQCKANADAARSITLEMSKGYPLADPNAVTRSYHAVSKLTWTLLNCGIAITDSAQPHPALSGKRSATERHAAR